jgi:CHAT domain-containing protein/Tfp pilus assembly protein PilF
LKKVLYCLSLCLLLCGFGAISTESAKDPLLEAYLRAQQLAESGRYRAALDAAELALQLGEAELAADDFRLGLLVNEVAALHYRLGDYRAATRLFEQALQLKQQDPPISPPDLALAQNNLAAAYRASGRLSDAEILQRQALQLERQHFGTSHLRVADSLNNLATILQAQGAYQQAHELFLQAYAVYQRQAESSSPRIVGLLNNLALIEKLLGRFDNARDYYQSALGQAAQQLSEGHPQQVRILANLAALHRELGDFEPAEDCYRKALSAFRQRPEDMTAETMGVLNGFASLLTEQGREQAAAGLYQQILLTLAGEGKEKSLLGAALYNNLGQLALQQGQLDAARERLGKAEKIMRTVQPLPQLWLAAVLHNLGRLQQQLKQPEQAESSLREALQLTANTVGAEHYQNLPLLANLAAALKQQGNLAEAAETLAEALRLAEQRLPKTHPQHVELLNSAAAVALASGRMEQADGYSKQAVEMVTQRFAIRRFDKRDRQLQRYVLLDRVSLLLRRAEENPQQRNHFAGQAFELAQWAITSRAGEALQQLVERFSSGDDDLAALLRQRQDLSIQQSGLGRRLDDLLLSMRPEGVTEQLEIGKQLENIAQQTQQLTAEISSRFPAYAELELPRVAAIEQVQALLGPREALLLIMSGSVETCLWLVQPDSVQGQRLSLTRAELTKSVAALRRGLDQGDVIFADELRPFDLQQAQQLYRKLLGGFDGHLQQVKQLITVVEGPLLSLPLSVLVRSPLPEDVAPGDAYRQADWLIRHLDIQRLPTVSSLVQLRRQLQASQAQQNFIGFGDPLLTDYWGAQEAQRGAVAVADVKRLPRLPDTATELKKIAALFRPTGRLHLGVEASEKQVAALPLDNYRVISFAGHALLANDLPGLREPALVLTPPEDLLQGDGLLTASEIATLKLDAELVVLSACNTAGADGSLLGEGLSGLARSFLYAGSRNLLVSHWPVGSKATGALMEEFFRHWLQQGQKRPAAALTAAMRTLRQDEQFSHPLYWAPFMLIGAESSPSKQIAEK